MLHTLHFYVVFLEVADWTDAFDLNGFGKLWGFSLLQPRGTVVSTRTHAGGEALVGRGRVIGVL